MDGKVKEVKRFSTSQKKNVSFDYDAMGNQIAKHIINNQTGILERSTYYILDARGNQMNVYEHEVDSSEVRYNLKERHIYGSAHLGVVNAPVNMYSTPSESPINEVLGERLYSLSDHRSNVNTVITDIKIPLSDDNQTVTGYQAYIVNVADYSPFNVELDGRTQKNQFYRISVQGQEHHDEILGDGNYINYKYRGYDPRVGRLDWAVDPLADVYSFNSPYAFSENQLIQYVELEGLEIGEPGFNSARGAELLISRDASATSQRQKEEVKAAGDVIGYPIVGVGIGGAMGAIGLRAIVIYLLEEVAEELAGFPIFPDPGDAIQHCMRKKVTHTPVNPSPKRVMPNDPPEVKRDKRASLVDEWMSKSKADFIDLDKPVYPQEFNKGDVLYQYRRPGTDEGSFFVRSKDISPEQVGLLSAEYTEVYMVTVNGKTKGLVSTHIENGKYYRDNSTTVEGGGEQIYAPSISPRTATFEKQ